MYFPSNQAAEAEFLKCCVAWTRSVYSGARLLRRRSAESVAAMQSASQPSQHLEIQRATGPHGGQASPQARRESDRFRGTLFSQHDLDLQFPLRL